MTETRGGKGRAVLLGRPLLYAGLAVVGSVAFGVTWRMAGRASPAAPPTGQISSQPHAAVCATAAVRHSALPADDYALTLVSAAHPLQGAPQNLVNIQQHLGQPAFALKSDQMRACAEAVTALQQMMQAAADDDVTGFSVQSAYRGEEYQRTLFEEQVRQCIEEGLTEEQAREKAALTVARPTHSEHETGLAFDIVAESSADLWAFQGTPQKRWLEENCWEYGFIVRYPPDKEDITGIVSEPWHFRYVGLPHARNIREQGLCLEEYLAP
ncbi:MAG: M15 family metallopeptidase [Eubacteriales bacterium]|nr:M15 family metallopeptidase [Eubacteriales bacterium]